MKPQPDDTVPKNIPAATPDSQPAALPRDYLRQVRLNLLEMIEQKEYPPEHRLKAAELLLREFAN